MNVIACRADFPASGETYKAKAPSRTVAVFLRFESLNLYPDQFPFFRSEDPLAVQYLNAGRHREYGELFKQLSVISDPQKGGSAATISAQRGLVCDNRDRCAAAGAECA